MEGKEPASPENASRREPAAGQVHDQRLVVEDQRVRLPAAAPKGLMDREPLLEVGGPRHLAGDAV